MKLDLSDSVALMFAPFGRLIDEQISIALETRESLVSQREILKVRQSYPSLNIT